MVAETTKLPAKGDPDALYVIDISSYIFRAYHAMPPLSNSRGEPTHAVSGVTTMLMKLIKEQQPVRLAVARDSRGGSFRKDIYGKYKANRAAPPPDLAQQIERVGELLEAWRIPAPKVAGFEADDLIAAFAARAKAQKLKLVIVSADKDLLQLVGDGCVMWDTMRNRVFGVPETIEKFGIPPHQVRDLLSLTGDASDNVPGVPSIGPKTAAKLLKAHEDLDGVYANVQSFKAKAMKQKLIDNKEQAYLSQELVTLRADVPLDVKDEDMVYDGGDPVALRKLFTELEFTRLLARLDPAPTAEGSYRTVLELSELSEIMRAVTASTELAVYSVLDSDDAVTGNLVGISLCWSEGVGAYIPLAHRNLNAPTQLAWEDVKSHLEVVLKNSLFPKLTADLKRERIVFARHGITLRGARFDTMLASYLLEPGRHAHDLKTIANTELDVTLKSEASILKPKKGPKIRMDEADVDTVREFAAQHADYAMRLSHLLETRMDHGDFRRLFHELELPLAKVLADLEQTGIRVDAELLKGMSVEAEKEIDELTALCHELAGKTFNVGSPRQLETILFDELSLPVIKRTKTARSTDMSVLDELASMHDLPGAILDLRSLVKLKSTYLDALPAAMNPDTGRVHTRFNQAVAATGRLSSSNPNLQNIPIRTEQGRMIRTAFVPAEGYRIMAADYSQIELRVLAHLSQDAELLDAYRKDADVHVRTASALFEVPVDKVNKKQRAQAKTVNFAVIYGQTRFALAKNLRISKTDAQKYIDAFFERYEGVKRFMDETAQLARDTGYVTTMLGRRRSVADIRSRNPALRNAAERIACNTPIQGTAADIIKIAMIRIHGKLRTQGMHTKMLLSVHDELVFEAPPEEVKTAESLVRSEMEAAMELAVPLKVDLGWGDNWGAAH